MYVCICNAVTEREIRRAVECGCDSMREIACELGVGTCCGKCVKEAKRVIREHKKEMQAENAELGNAATC